MRAKAARAERRWGYIVCTSRGEFDRGTSYEYLCLLLCTTAAVDSGYIGVFALVVSACCS